TILGTDLKQFQGEGAVLRHLRFWKIQTQLKCSPLRSTTLSLRGSFQQVIVPVRYSVTELPLRHPGLPSHRIAAALARHCQLSKSLIMIGHFANLLTLFFFFLFTIG